MLLARLFCAYQGMSAEDVVQLAALRLGVTGLPEL